MARVNPVNLPSWPSCFVEKKVKKSEINTIISRLAEEIDDPYWHTIIENMVSKKKPPKGFILKGSILKVNNNGITHVLDFESCDIKPSDLVAFFQNNSSLLSPYDKEKIKFRRENILEPVRKQDGGIKVKSKLFDKTNVIADFILINRQKYAIETHQEINLISDLYYGFFRKLLTSKNVVFTDDGKLEDIKNIKILKSGKIEFSSKVKEVNKPEDYLYVLDEKIKYKTLEPVILKPRISVGVVSSGTSSYVSHGKPAGTFSIVSTM